MRSGGKGKHFFAMNKNTMEKRRLVRELVARHYEPGRQDRCKRWVYRNVVLRIYPMSERTFYRYIGSGNEGEERHAQPTLF
jgi:hypothetical protein